MKTVYIMRGISGSGKSTVASKLSIKEDYICSTDKYFMVNGEYKFDRSKLGEYHKRNFELFSSFLAQDVPVVVVDNTNCKRKEFKRYIDKAKEHGYEVFEVAVGNPWRSDGDMRWIDDEYVKKCIERNRHAVPADVIRQQALNFEC
jgi:predicted kinase